MVPHPGDWYLLKNYQPALMKPYSDAGLSALAKVHCVHLAISLQALNIAHNSSRPTGFFWKHERQFIGLCLPSSLHILSQMIRKVINPLQNSSHRPFYQYSHSLIKIFENLIYTQLAGMKTLLKKSFQQFQSFIQSQATVRATKKAEGAQGKGFMRKTFPTN